MSEQCCGTCRFYAKDGEYIGDCLWAEGRAVPSCMEYRSYPVGPYDGGLCQVYAPDGDARPMESF